MCTDMERCQRHIKSKKPVTNPYTPHDTIFIFENIYIYKQWTTYGNTNKSYNLMLGEKETEGDLTQSHSYELKHWHQNDTKYFTI